MAAQKPKGVVVGGSLAKPCKACGTPLVFATSEDTGKIIPLDVSNYPTYMLVIHEGVATAKRSPAYISHSVTCPDRDQFKKGKKEDGVGECHCGKAGHARGSINCPVHGERERNGT